MPASLSPSGIALEQNPILSRVVQGLRNQSDKFVGQFMCPKVPVENYKGQLLVFDNSSKVLYDTKRARGADTKRRTIGWTGLEYTLEQDRLEGKITVEDLRDTNAYSRTLGQTGRIPYNLERRIVKSTMESIELTLEVDIKNLLTTPANYKTGNVITLMGSSQFNDPTSDPLGVFDDIRDLCSAGVNEECNSALIGRNVFNRLINHPQIRGYINGVAIEVVQEQRLAQILRLNRGLRVARGKVLVDGTIQDLSDIWGDVIIAGYVPMTQNPEREEPSFAYTYHLKNYPIVEPAYQERNNNSWYYPVTDERRPYIVDNGAAVLVQNAVA